MDQNYIRWYLLRIVCHDIIIIVFKSHKTTFHNAYCLGTIDLFTLFTSFSLPARCTCTVVNICIHTNNSYKVHASNGCNIWIKVFSLSRIRYIVLLISQLIPVNPLGQLQEYDAKPSVHVALFLQGLGVQSSISKWINKVISYSNEK